MKKLLALLLFALPCMGQNPLFITSSFNTATAATPTFSPAAGAVAESHHRDGLQHNDRHGAARFYFDTSPTPTTAQTTYSVTTAVTLYAQVRGCSGYNDSAVASAAYTINTCTPPTMTYRWAAYNSSNRCGTTGGSSCTSNGQAVYSLGDLVGSNTGVQTNTFYQELYETNMVNGLPALQGNGGSRNQFILNTFIPNTNNYTVYAVVYYTTSIPTYLIFLGEQVNATLSFRKS